MIWKIKQHFDDLENIFWSSQQFPNASNQPDKGTWLQQKTGDFTDQKHWGGWSGL